MGYFPFVTASSSSSGYPAEPVVSGTPTAGQVLTAETATTATWENSVEIAGDLGGTDADPEVISTHLTAAAPAWASTVNLDPTSTRVFTVTQTGNTTYTFTPAGSLTSGVSYSFELYTYQDATGGRTITFTASGLAWTGGAAPAPDTAASALNLYVFETTNAGTSWTGTLVQPLNLPVTVANGGTGGAELGAYELMAGGITTTSPVQSVSGTGTAGQALASNGAGALPTFQTLFLEIANNLSDLASAATARSSLGLGSAAVLAAAAVAQTANNLSDLADAATARANLGLGAVATEAYVSGQYLCAPSIYAPATLVTIETLSATLAALNATATTVGAGSNGGEISTIATWGGTYGGSGVLDVANTAGWPNAGTITVATSTTPATVTYTGITATSLTGCAYVSGSATGTVATGGAVTPTAAGTGAAALPDISTGSFTPPGSSVIVTVSLVCSQGTTADYLTFSLANHGSLTPICDNNITQCLSGARALPYVLTFLVTGLSGAQNFDLLFGVNAAELFVYAYGTESATAGGASGGPVVMTVQAV